MVVGIPIIYWSGTEGEFNIMVIEQLDQNLQELLNTSQKTYHKPLPLNTVLEYGEQIVRRLEYIHSKGYVHRDLKPENLMIGMGDKANLLYLIDYGLSKKYVHRITNKKIAMTGTAQYSSLNTHIGLEQTRRDDLESAGYVLIHLAKGALPWNSIRGTTKEQMQDKIMEIKNETSMASLCRGIGSKF